MSATASTTAPNPTRIVIAGAGQSAQALVRQLDRKGFTGSITVLSNRDDCTEELLQLAALPQVSVRFGQPAAFIDPEGHSVTTADGMEFRYDLLVIATGAAPALPPVEGATRCLSYSTVDDAAGIGKAVKEVTRVLGRRPLGILVGTGPSAGQAEAVLRARGVRPIRTTERPAAVVPTVAGSVLPAAGILFEDGSRMNADLVVLAEERSPKDELALSAGLRTAPGGGIAVAKDFSTTVSGIWAIGDAASFDGVRLGLMVSAEAAAGICSARLLEESGQLADRPQVAA
ncbi:FAD-dependent oxidoreductase [Arthrobacter sp. ISL-30]|uniref:FAD-dependent oxidoreductase n=1 Tax=Arthrobacter sp. ISL-30 TaxID=2819109 RepID=UPI001BE84B8B|nr:FAD-dependent oxidoreductase [Arthrobacter sp. ISL-30]MBT2514063.1 FAD-dependent oxidoreductase [Arthrobacter sp. ISL-30]